MLAAPIAIKTIVEFLRQGEHDLDEVRIVLYPREDERAYPVFAAALNSLLADRFDAK
jgi:O-acetyl-ADP-ribose deacetylase (regulator of RNase III)